MNFSDRSVLILMVMMFATTPFFNVRAQWPALPSPSTVVSLPIELIRFDAHVNGTKVDLRWATAYEVNNDLFIIERTKNAVDFEVIAVTPGAGNSNSVINYHEMDMDPLYGASYYRLKQIDFNGDFTISELVPINFMGQHGSIVTVSPNPVVPGQPILLKIAELAGLEVFVEMIDQRGLVMYSDNVTLDANGSCYLTRSELGIPPGVYHVSTIVQGEHYGTSLVIE